MLKYISQLLIARYVHIEGGQLYINHMVCPKTERDKNCRKKCNSKFLYLDRHVIYIQEFFKSSSKVRQKVYVVGKKIKLKNK